MMNTMMSSSGPQVSYPLCTYRVEHARIAKAAVYDGKKNMFLPEDLKLPEDGEVFTVEIPDDGSVPVAGSDVVRFVLYYFNDGDRMCKFEIKIRKVKEINMQRLHEYFANKLKATSMMGEDYPSDAIMVLEVLLRSNPSMRFSTTGTQSGGSFFSPNPASASPSN
jgi:hypothetical protein